MKTIARSGSWIVFLGALLGSLNSPLIKAAIAGVALLPFLRLSKQRLSVWTAVYAVSYTVLCFSVVYTLSLTSAPIAIGMQYTAAIWLFVAGVVATGRIKKQALPPLAVITAGVILFMCSGLGGATNMRGNLIALTEGITFALASVSSKKASGKNPLGLVAIANLFAAVAGFLILSFTPRSFAAHLHSLDGRQWMVMLVLGIVQCAGGYAAYNVGLQYVTAQRASILAMWEMILGPVWVALFLHEIPSVLEIIGLLFIFVGVYLETRRKTETDS